MSRVPGADVSLARALPDVPGGRRPNTPSTGTFLSKRRAPPLSSARGLPPQVPLRLPAAYMPAGGYRCLSSYAGMSRLRICARVRQGSWHERAIHSQTGP